MALALCLTLIFIAPDILDKLLYEFGLVKYREGREAESSRWGGSTKVDVLNGSMASQWLRAKSTCSPRARMVVNTSAG